MTATIDVSGVAKRYAGGTEALRDMSFSIGSGETVALVGHNGAGKTTLIKMLLGLIRPTAGRVNVLGEDPASGHFEVRKALGYVPESVSFHLALTGRETLAFYARLKKVPRREIDALFERVGLDQQAADRPVKTYSKGMRQRLGLAQALLGAPRVLLLDEPTSGLDPALRRNFYLLMDELRAAGTTILLSSHALSELEDRAGRVIIVNRGLKIADGTLDELRHIARLPVRIRVRPAPGTAFAEASALRWTPTLDSVFEAEVRPEDKLAILHLLTADPAAFSELTVLEPTLDDLYAHFLQSGGAA